MIFLSIFYNFYPSYPTFCSNLFFLCHLVRGAEILRSFVTDPPEYRRDGSSAGVSGVVGDGVPLGVLKKM